MIYGSGPYSDIPYGGSKVAAGAPPAGGIVLFRRRIEGKRNMILGKYNQAKTITFELFQIDGIDIEPAATFATGDIVIMGDEGAEANTTNLPTDEGTGYSLVLTAGEMSAARIRLYIIDQTGPKVWLDTSINIETYGDASGEHAFDLDTASTAQTGDNYARLGAPAGASISADILVIDDFVDGIETAVITNAAGVDIAADIIAIKAETALIVADTNELQTDDVPGLIATAQADLDIITDSDGVVVGAAGIDLVWDEVLTGATHNVNQSSGKRLRELAGAIFAEGTAQSGGNNTIQLAAGDVTADNQFIRAKVLVVDGTGVNQEAIITSSVASTDTLTITPAWLTNPDATSDYIIIPAQAHSTVRNGGYDRGHVYVDTVNGTAGTQKGVNGTTSNPSSNLTDAYVVAAQESISSFFIEPGSVITLPSDSSDMEFEGFSYDLALNGQDIDNTTFKGASVSGIATAGAGNSPSFLLCGIGTVTLPPCNGNECGFFGTFTMGSAGSFTFGASASVFDLSLIIDYGSGLNASSFYLQSYGGGDVEIQNAGAGTGTYKFQMNGYGDLTVNANCSATTEVTLRGNISRNADVTGITYVEVASNVELIGIVDTVVDTILVDTADMQPKLGTPAADVSADIAAVKVDTAAILVDTGTTLDTYLTDIQGATFNTATDSLEAVRDRGDAAWITGGGGADKLVLQTTDIATLATQTSFTLTAGSADNDAYNNCTIVIEDVVTSVQKAVATVTDYVGSTRTITLGAAPAFTIATTDNVYILANYSTAVKTDTDAILVDTGTTLDTKLDDIQGATFNNATDSLEAIRDRGDSAWVTGAGGNDRTLLLETTVSSVTSQTVLVLNAGSVDDDAYNNCPVVIEDAVTAAQKSVGFITDYDGGTNTITLREASSFTVAATDNVYILASGTIFDDSKNLTVTKYIGLKTSLEK